jgi:hypothetical protein
MISEAWDVIFGINSLMKHYYQLQLSVVSSWTLKTVFSILVNRVIGRPSLRSGGYHLVWPLQVFVPCLWHRVLNGFEHVSAPTTDKPI